MRDFFVSISLMLALAGNVWSQSMTEPDKSFKTWCVGRFLVDLPREAEFVGEDNEYDWTWVKSERSSLPDFQTTLQKREADLRSRRHDVDPSLLRRAVDVGENARILTFWEDSWSKFLVKIEGYRYLAGRKYILSTEFEPQVEELSISLMKDSLTALRTRAISEIPAVPGFCINQGFFPDEGRKHESAGITFRFKQHPDVSLSITTIIKAVPGPGLIERSKKSLLSLGSRAAYIQTLREVDRDLGPLKGQESLEKAPGYESRIGHNFMWETQGHGRSDYPFISIQLETALQGAAGEGLPASLTDREALALWDAILNSFRLRPTGDAATPEQPKPVPRPQSKAPLGTQLISGSRCPQTGTWICDHHEALGGNRRYFTEGETLSSVMVPAKRDLWQQLKGDAKNRPQETIWTLADISIPKTGS